MRALEELPEHDKDLMLPIVLLRPWLRSKELSSSLEKVEESFGKRTVVLDIDAQYDASAGEELAAAKELKALQDQSDGFKKWCDFVVANENIIPCLQFGEPGQTAQQLSTLLGLNRGLVVKIPKQGFGALANVVASLAGTDSGDLLFVLDMQDDLVSVATCEGYIKTILASLPDSAVAVAASSFPDSFDGITDKRIEERRFHLLLCESLKQTKIHYADYGSARAIRNSGGGRIIPRIDYPTTDHWYFFRKDEADGYVKAAKDVVDKAKNKHWEPQIRVWGTQMIERTAKGDTFAIISPVRATAVRINLHLHRQVHFANPAKALEDMEDDWVD
jgi:hypothetical protein